LDAELMRKIVDLGLDSGQAPSTIRLLWATVSGRSRVDALTERDSEQIIRRAVSVRNKAESLFGGTLTVASRLKHLHRLDSRYLELLREARDLMSELEEFRLDLGDLV
jgi:hypothetical protein